MIKTARPPNTLYFIRQSFVLLVIRLIFIEIVFTLIYLIFRVPQLFFIDFISPELFVDLSIYSVIYYGFISLFQIIVVVFVTLRWVHNYYFIRQNDILHRQGVINLKEETFSLKNIEAFTIVQDALGKFFNFGTIKFYSPVLKRKYFLYNVPDPLNLKQTIEKLLTLKGNLKRKDINEFIIPIKGK